MENPGSARDRRPPRRRCRRRAEGQRLHPRARGHDRLARDQAARVLDLRLAADPAGRQGVGEVEHRRPRDARSAAARRGAEPRGARFRIEARAVPECRCLARESRSVAIAGETPLLAAPSRCRVGEVGGQPQRKTDGQDPVHTDLDPGRQRRARSSAWPRGATRRPPPRSSGRSRRRRGLAARRRRRSSPRRHRPAATARRYRRSTAGRPGAARPIA